MRAKVLSILIALAAGSAAAQVRPPACMAPEYRQFDFWAGDWIVHGKNGNVVGTNRITKELGGCLVHERYETERGYRGESLNAYDATRKAWRQSWVDNGGLVLLLEGGLRDGRMVLEGETRDAAGQAVRNRITWTPNEDGSVRQHWEVAGKEGQWTTSFDGRYVRR